MRIVATEYVSLDGFFHEPGQWSMPYFDPAVAAFKAEELAASDALLLGRKTYEGFAAAWPKMREATGDFGAKMNDMPKWVVTSTLSEPSWTGARVVRGDVIEEVRRLAAMPGNDLLLAGSGQLFQALRAANLIERYRFLVHPILLGRGMRLFTGEDERPLKLVHSRAFGSGIVLVEYEPAEASADVSRERVRLLADV